MLAFSVSIRDGLRHVAYWYAQPEFLSTIRKYVETGEIEIVELNGGYPNDYTIDSLLAAEWLTGLSPDMRIHRVQEPQIDYEALGNVSTFKLKMQLWDQS